MTLEARIKETEQKFEQKSAEREQHLTTANDCLTEMTKLQGEYRILKDLLQDKKPNKRATVIEAVPEEK